MIESDQEMSGQNLARVGSAGMYRFGLNGKCVGFAKFVPSMSFPICGNTWSLDHLTFELW